MARSTTSTAPAATTAKVAKPKATRVQAVVAKATGRTPKIASKVCRVCGLNKPLTDYRAKASRPDGRDSICTVDARAWLANRKAILAAQAKPVAKAKATAKVVAKPATRVAKVAAVKAKVAALPAREAAARARDAKARTATVAK